MKQISLKIAAFMLYLLAVGCGNRKAETTTGDELVTVGDSSLLLGDVLMRIPHGLAPEDSAEMFHQIVDRWIESMVLSDIARENVPDIDKINRMAESYRNNLIIAEYLKRMDGGQTKSVDEGAVKAYYNEHREELVLQAPVVKGVYVKTSDTDDRLENIRRWMESATDASIDNLEKYGLRQAAQYEYFNEEWVDWSDIAELIPYKFFDADAFLQSTKNFETSYGGSTYFLHIFQYVPSGEPMPEDYAENKIRTLLEERNSSLYRERLIRSIYKRQIGEGRLRSGLYDPLKGEMKSKKTKIKKNKQ